MAEYWNIAKFNFFYGLANDKLVRKFSRIKTVEKHFMLALKVITPHYDALIDLNCARKVLADSIKFRNDGNKSFLNHRYYEAIQQYTASIIYAVDSSEELAVAYANRSAALFKLEKYLDCIEDIDRALSQPYPDKLKTKLYQRKGFCLKVLGRPGAETPFQEALSWLDKSGLTTSERTELEIKLKKLIATPYKTVPKPADNVTLYPKPEILVPSAEIPCASDAVAMNYSEKFGRHVVATRNIKPGEVLVVEKPYCSRLIPKHMLKYCSYCLQVSWSMIPCTQCVNAAYCSESCRTEAFEKYHELECLVVGPLLTFRFNNVYWIAIRATLTLLKKATNWDELREELDEVNDSKDPRTKGYSADGKFHSDQYRTIYSMSNDFLKCSMQHVVNRSLGAALTVCLLAKTTNMFGENLMLDTLATNPKVAFVGALILKHIYIANINLDSFGGSRSNSHTEHGHVLMSFCNLFNHSCDSNVLKQWHVDRLTLFAAYPIEEGEQIFVCYGPRFIITPKHERKQKLQHWHFDCDCVACINNWPLIPRLPSYTEKRLSRSDQKTLNRTMLDFTPIPKILLSKRQTDNVPDLLNRLLEVIETFYRIAKRPCLELSYAVSILKTYSESANTIFQYEPVITGV